MTTDDRVLLLLGKIDGTLEALVERFNQHLAADEKAKDEANERLCSLERIRWQHAGALSLVSFVAAFVGEAVWSHVIR